MLDLLNVLTQYWAFTASIWPLYLEGMGRVYLFNEAMNGVS